MNNFSSFTIIGAGIVGLATALKLREKLPDAKILILEKESKVAAHQTGNNSGVIHSGIYYQPGSLKAKNCVSGYKMLLDFCDEHNVKYDICGKVIVAANEDEVDYLNILYERGIDNSLSGLKMLSDREIKEIEPNVNGIAGILVPQTGIVDFLEVAEKMKDVLESRGVEIKFNEKVENIKRSEVIEISTNQQIYKSTNLISCAGLQSDRVAALTEENLNVRIIPFRGEYYKLKNESKSLVNSLIYPVPDPAFPFLGVHFTRMINGDVEAGPNAVFAFKREGYTKSSFNFNDTLQSMTWPGFIKVVLKYWKTGFGEFYRSYNKKAFVRALQKLIPEITEADLEKGGAGVRAQACDIQGELLDDFHLIEKKNIIHVLNAPSPAATSALSIGDYFAKRAMER